MSRRLQQGSLFFDRRNENLAFAASLITMFTLAAIFGKGKDVMVDGQVERVATLGGQVVSKWLVFAIVVPLIVAVFLGWRKVFDQAWPEDDIPAPAEGSQVVDVEEIHERSDGGFVAWQPEVPGTPSPMDYTPPNFTPETTAEEYLTARQPHPMRALLGVDSLDEDRLFSEAAQEWLKEAPEEKIVQLLTVAKGLSADGASEDVAAALARANRVRGIPAEAELVEFLGSDWTTHDDGF
jgi:hypothetical protein